MTGLLALSTTINAWTLSIESKYWKPLFSANSHTLTWNLTTTLDHYHYMARPSTGGYTYTTIRTVVDSDLLCTWPKIIPIERPNKQHHDLHALFLLMIYLIHRSRIPQYTKYTDPGFQWPHECSPSCTSHYLSSHHRFWISIDSHMLNVLSRHNRNNLFFILQTRDHKM